MLLLCCVVLGAATGCSRDTGPSPAQGASGAVAIALSTRVDSVSYRLRHALFDVSGPVSLSLDSDAEPEAEILSQSLTPGVYEIVLGTGWTLERQAASGYEAVAATLLSSARQQVTISAGQSSLVRYALRVDGGEVVLGDGELRIGIDVAPSAQTQGIRALTGGGSHTCALLAEGTVRCWGSGSDGRLGYASEEDVSLPVLVGDIDLGGQAVQIDAGESYTCALLTSGGVRCWGLGGAALGYGHNRDIGDDETPASAGDVVLGGRAIAIAAGVAHTCALLDTGRVRCWGSAFLGALGYGNTVAIGDDETPASAGDVELGGTAIQIATGYHHTCAVLEGGRVRCWGPGNNGRLGYANGETVGDDETPASVGDVEVGAPVLQIVAGYDYTCALVSGGDVRCWGMHANGHGDGTIGDDETPASAGNVDLGGKARLLAGGENHACALLDTGRIRCWGMGASAQLGYGNREDVGVPAAAGDVNVGALATALAAGGNHTCAILVTGGVRCWGTGPLGYGRADDVGDDEAPATLPEVVVRPEILLAVTHGDNQSGVVAAELSEPIVLHASAANGLPAVGQRIQFNLLSGAGSVRSPALETDAEGNVTQYWTLGLPAGVQTLEARALSDDGRIIAAALIRATMVSAPTLHIVAESGDGQSDVHPFSPYPEPLTVLVTNAQGNGVAGVYVDFIPSNGGIASPSRLATDATGRASTIWSPGPIAQRQTLRASAAGVGEVVFGGYVIPDQPGLWNVTGNNQFGAMGAPLAEPLVVRLLDQDARPIVGARVAFSDANEMLAEAVTDERGLASTTWTLARQLGTQTLWAGVLGPSGFSRSVMFSATALMSPLGSVSVVQGDQQVGAILQALPQPVTVVVRDEFGAPVAGATVSFFARDSGHADPDLVLTDSAGLASSSWTLGYLTGPQSFGARVRALGNIDLEANAHAEARFGPRDPQGDQQSAAAGTTLPMPLAVYVLDGSNNPVVGQAVSFTVSTGGGAFSPAIAYSDATGRAQASWTLGPYSGVQTARVEYPGRSFSFSAIADPELVPTTLEIISGNHQSLVVGSTPSAQLTVRVLNSAGRPQLGAVVDSVATNEEGVATLDWPIGSRAGVRQRELRVQGSSVAATADITVLPGPPASIRVLQGADQLAWLGELLEPFSIVISDEYGNPIPGAATSFVAGEGGEVSPSSATTDAAGLVSVRWRLGPAQAGLQTLTVRADAALTTLAAVANIAPAEPFTIAKVAGDLQSVNQHARLVAPLRVRVTDGAGTPLDHVAVRFASLDAGVDDLSAQVVYTTSDGVASWQGYLHVAGERHIQALIPGHPGVPFMVQVAAADHPLDGAYGCAYGNGDGDSFVIANGVLQPVPEGGRARYFATFSEQNGALEYVTRRSLDYRNWFLGQLVANAAGRAIGIGTASTYFDPNRDLYPITPAICTRW